MALAREIAALGRAIATDPLRIVEVIRVVDTRQWEEGPDEKWYPIPGSGNQHECSRCGRLHEVHAEVRLANGTTDVVGTGCAERDSMEVAAMVKTATSREKRARRLRAEIAANERAVAAAREAEQRVAAMPVPPLVTDTIQLPSGREMRVARVGDTEVWLGLVRSEYDMKERTESAVSSWRNARMAEILGIGFRPLCSLLSDGKALQRKLAQLEKTRP